jgi:peptidoglycan/LPS O-acetylase OafA/YrhL
MRAAAALSVVGYHVFRADKHLLGRLAEHLNIGVTIFFLISGFLLYRPYVSARWLGTQPPGLVVYLRRRALRIVPAYWFALAAIALYPGGPPDLTDRPWLFFGFAQVYSSKTVFAGIAPAWTLCVEVTFYLLLPFYAVLAARLAARMPWQRAVAAEGAMLACLGAGAVVFHAAEGPASPLGLTLPGMLDWFALGMGLALVSVSRELKAATGAPPSRRVPSVVLWLAAAACYAVVCLALGLPRGEPGDAFIPSYSTLQVGGEHVAYGLIALLALIPALFGSPRQLPQRILAHRSLMWVGLVSYGIYLWHVELIGKLDKLGVVRDHLVVKAPLVFAAAIAAGAGSYYVVERPFLRRKEAGRRRPATASAPPAGRG